MKLSKVLLIAGRGLANNKLRSLLTMLGVIIGVAAVIVMVSVSAGTEKSIEEQISKLGSNLLFVQSSFGRMRPGAGGPPSGGLVYNDAAAIANGVSGVAGVIVEQNSSETVKNGETTLDDVSIYGTTPDYPVVRGMTVATGRYFTEDDNERKRRIAVLGSTIASELFPGQDPVGQLFYIGKYKFTVIGVMESKGVVGSSNYDEIVFIPIKVVFEKFTPAFFARVMGDQVRQITIKLEDGADTDYVTTQINYLLMRRHKVSADELDFSVKTQQDVVESREATTAAFRQLLAWVAGVSLIVGGIGIMNIMLVSVTERTREIGIRQAIGATQNDIRMQFLTEALLISIVGGLIGVILGVGGSWLFGKFGNMPTVVVPTSIVVAFLSSAAVGIVFGYFPANKAAQLDPIQALRHE